MFVTWLVWMCVLMFGKCGVAEVMPAIAVHMHTPFNPTLGFPGEGPSTIAIVTANVTTARAIKEGKLDLPDGDVWCIQETKLSDAKQTASLAKQVASWGFQSWWAPAIRTAKGGSPEGNPSCGNRRFTSPKNR
jgi:hypothetical protein